MSSLNRLLHYLRPVLLLVAILLLLYLIQKIGPAKLLALTLNFSPAWICAVILCCAVNISLAAIRYRTLVAPELEYSNVLEIVMAGYLLNYASMIQGLGLGAKIGLMKGQNIAVNRSLAGSIGEILLDIIFTGTVSAIFFTCIGFGASGNPMFGQALIILPVVVIGVAFGLHFFSKISRFGAKLEESLQLAFTAKNLPVSILSTIGIWTIAGAGYYCMILASGTPSANIQPFLSLAAICVGFITGLISFVPGGIGVREITWAYVASMAGTPLEVSGAAALLLRVISILTIALWLGLWTLFKRHKKRYERK